MKPCSNGKRYVSSVFQGPCSKLVLSSGQLLTAANPLMLNSKVMWWQLVGSSVARLKRFHPILTASVSRRNGSESRYWAWGAGGTPYAAYDA